MFSPYSIVRWLRFSIRRLGPLVLKGCLQSHTVLRCDVILQPGGGLSLCAPCRFRGHWHAVVMRCSQERCTFMWSQNPCAIVTEPKKTARLCSLWTCRPTWCSYEPGYIHERCGQLSGFDLFYLNIVPGCKESIVLPWLKQVEIFMGQKDLLFRKLCACLLFRISRSRRLDSKVTHF